MATWRRCPGSSFYRRSGGRGRFDRRAEAFDVVYEDPVDLVLIRTIPLREDEVSVLKWRVVQLEPQIYSEVLRTDQAQILGSWAERVAREMEGGISNRQKEGLLSDLDVDLHERDLLLDAVEGFMHASPPEATTFREVTVFRKRGLVDEILYHFGVKPKPC